MDTSLSPPAEITAEWTVHAQLTIVRGDALSKSPTATAPDQDRESVLRRNNGCNEQPTSPASFGVGNSPDALPKTMTSTGGFGGAGEDGPLRVVYKWSTDDLKAGCGGRNGRGFFNFGTNQSFTSSSNSTCGGIGGRSSDSGCCQNMSNDVDSSAVDDLSPKCRSTCSIVLTACTDLYPTTVGGASEDSMAPPQYNTTATCVVTPSPGEIYRPKTKMNDPVAQFLSVKDAFCQTSDGEFKARSEPRTNSGQHHNQRTRSQRAYDFRRATESMLFNSSSLLSPNVSFEEGTTIAPFSRQPSHSPVLIRQVSTATSGTYSPGPNVRVHHTSSGVTHQHHYQPPTSAKPSAAQTPSAMAKKSPRTVHIDVYCTGSEAEDSDHSSTSHSSSGSTSSEAAHLASHPGYFINDDDAASNSTPQTVFNANQIRLHHSRITNRRELPRRLTPASNESSSLPQPGHLRQFILDQANAAAAAADKNEINESKQMLFSKHMGDDVIETPLTKFSFSRHPGHFQQVEPSEGGFSSNYPNSSRSTFRDPTCSSISSHGALASSSAIADDLEQYGNLSGGDSFEYVGQDWSTATPDDLSSPVNKGWRSPEKERKFLLRQRKMLDFVQQNQQQMREQTEDREDEGPPIPNTIYNNVSGTPRHHKVLFTPNFEAAAEGRSWLTTGKPSSSIIAMDTQICRNVIESSHRATPFGARVEMTRKKHFGPAKNPDCLCDHCRRWLAERGAKQMMRGRAASVGEEQMVAKRSSFWLMRQ